MKLMVIDKQSFECYVAMYIIIVMLIYCSLLYRIKGMFPGMTIYLIETQTTFTYCQNYHPFFAVGQPAKLASYSCVSDIITLLHLGSM